FSVRTVGLAGLGALGVSFGTTLAFDSPAAKDAGPFNWGSTVWHELAHTFTLGSTEHRIPRWLSEGLSVYEEHRARPGWGFDVTPFDRKFDAYMRERFATALAGLDEFRVKTMEGRALMQSNQLDAAAVAFQRAKALFPQYGGGDSPTLYLSQIYTKRGDTRRA